MRNLICSLACLLGLTLSAQVNQVYPGMKVWAGMQFSTNATPANSAPVFTTDLTNQTVTLGSNAQFSVAASGTGTLGFRWFTNGVEWVSPPSISYLLQEDAEATGGVNNGFDLAGWVIGGSGTVNADYSASPLSGSQSIYMDCTGGTYCTIRHEYTAQDNSYVRFQFKIVGAIGTSTPLVRLYNTGTTDNEAQLMLLANGKLRVMDVGDTHDQDTTLALTQNTLYYGWLRCSKGTGANGVISVGVSTTTTEPTVGDAGYASVPTPNNTLQTGSLLLMADSINIIFDQVRVANTDIGSNP